MKRQEKRAQATEDYLIKQRVSNSVLFDSQLGLKVVAEKEINHKMCSLPTRAILGNVLCRSK